MEFWFYFMELLLLLLGCFETVRKKEAEMQDEINSFGTRKAQMTNKLWSSRKKESIAVEYKNKWGTEPKRQFSFIFFQVPTFHTESFTKENFNSLQDPSKLSTFQSPLSTVFCKNKVIKKHKFTNTKWKLWEFMPKQSIN